MIHWGNTVCVELRNFWFTAVLEDNQLQAEATAALSRTEALSLQ